MKDAAGNTWILRVEGVNFDATIDDTNDLSTIRGGSLALLRLGTVVTEVLEERGASPSLVFNGASQCAYRFQARDAADAEDIREAVAEAFRVYEGGDEPFQHLTFVVDVAEGGDERTTLPIAEARNRTRQFHQWTVTPQPFHAKARDADPLETIRPGTELVYLPPGKVLVPDDWLPPGATHEKRLLSETVAARRRFGRSARQGFYRCELGKDAAEGILGPVDKVFSFANEFGDIVVDPPPGNERTAKLPVSVRGKLAVFYADGNGFGKVRETMPIKEFSSKLGKFRKSLLRAILEWYVAGAKGDAWDAFAVREVYHDDQGHRFETMGLRFETLLWGGDEVLFVMPAWLAFPFVSGFLKTTAGWEKIGGVQLTHAIGVAIADRKTPIRQLTQIAMTAADLAKEAGLRDRDTVTFEIYESLAPPDTDLTTSRARLYGVRSEMASRLAGLLALPGDQFDTLVENMRTLKSGDGGEPFPRSQLYGAIRAARMEGDLTGTKAGDAAKAALDHFARRPGGKDLCKTLDGALPPVCAGVRPLALDLALITQFWDYACPLDGRLPTFGGAEDAR